ncbi:MAG: EVE domain-containing protein [Chloroflexi bacterium]|nr:EVE domain-containing protein [Chloroflexota bacterium]
MIVTNRENFEISKDLDFAVQGFETSQNRKSSRIAVDDRLLYYLSDERAFAAIATVKSEPFEADEVIWSHYQEGEIYAQRVETEPDVVLDEASWIDALQVGPRLEYVRKWAPEDWPLAFIGPLHVIPQKDFAFFEEEFQRASQRDSKKKSRSKSGQRKDHSKVAPDGRPD